MSNPSGAERLSQAIEVLGAIYGRQLSPAVIAVYVSDLWPYGVNAALESIERCRQELRTFPTIADIIQRIPSGHPSPEEAWNMVPKREGDSVVWTEEMAEAFGACSSLIDHDEIAARMAFLEKYRDLLARARTLKKPPRWNTSLGHDISGREAALKEAVARGRITAEHAQALLPRPERLSIVRDEEPALLTGEVESTRSPEEALKYIREVMARVKGVAK